MALAYYNRGNAFSSKNQYELAIDDYTKAIELDPKNADAFRAWVLSLESLFHAGRYVELEQSAREFLKQPVTMTEEQRKRAEHLLHFAQFEQARSEEKAGRYAEAAKQYEVLVREAPRMWSMRPSKSPSNPRMILSASRL